MNTYSALALLSLIFLVKATNLTIITPSALVECQPTAISWSGGTEPYYVAVIPGGEPSEAALESFPTQTGESYVWTVNIGNGTSVSFKVTDSLGTLAYSDAVTIQAGTETTCVNVTSTATSTSAVSSVSGSESSTTTSKSGSTSSDTSTSSSSASTTSTTTGGANTISAAIGLGLIALLAAIAI